MWRKPLRWNKRAAHAGHRSRVSCASLADVFDNQVEPSCVPTSGSSSARRPPSIGCSSPNVPRISGRCFRLTGPTAGRTSGSARRRGSSSTIVSAGRFSPASGNGAVHPYSRRSHRSLARRRRWRHSRSGYLRRRERKAAPPAADRMGARGPRPCEAHGIRSSLNNTAVCAGTAAAASSTVARGRNGRWRRERRREWSRLIATAKSRSRIAIADRCPCLAQVALVRRQRL